MLIHPRVIAILALALAAGCASGRLKRETALAMAAADGAVLEGCYDCLLKARDVYATLAGSRYANRDTIALRRFETELLIALREKELVLDWRPTEARARAMLPQLPSTIDGARLLAIEDAVLPDGNGRVGDWPTVMRRERRPFVARIPSEIAWLSGAPMRSSVREYLALALDCSYDARVLAPSRQPGASQRRPVLQPGAPPVIIYRTGICMGPDTNMLAAVLAIVPAFHEAAYFAGTSAAFAAESDGGERASQLLRQGYRCFPDSPGVTFMSGWLAMELGDCPAALRMYDETVATDSTHEIALLQGAICLSRTHRDSAVVARTTRLIGMRGNLTQPAYYWRSLSRYRLKDLAGARADIETAKSLDRDANALTLAGVIENDQSELEVAEKDLREARGKPRGEQNCVAAYTLGLVLAKTARHSDTAESFESAASCYDLSVLLLKSRIDFIQRTARNQAYATKRITALAADSAEHRARYYLSSVNAAGYRANIGQFERAHQLLDIAAQDPRLADQVATLRKAIVAASARQLTESLPQ